MALTEWRNLTLAVHERAKPANLTLAAELAGLLKTPTEDLHKISRDEMRRRVRQSLAAAPGDLLTALELTTHLIWSPDAGAKFITPRPPKGDQAPMWSARLDPNTPTAVRAIWSPDLYLADIIAAPEDNATPPPLNRQVSRPDNFRLSLKALLAFSTSRTLASIRPSPRVRISGRLGSI